MNLLLFNLKTDADDAVLGFTTDWINALSRRFDRIHVITMTRGRLAVAENVRIYSAGKEKGYSEPRRLWEFFRILMDVLRKNRIDACFSHMIWNFALLAWPLLKIRRIPILLWYCHRAVPFLLRVTHLLVDGIVTPVPGSYPMRHAKVKAIGHGISEEKFRFVRRSRVIPFRVISLARISPVKHLDVIIRAMPFVLSEKGADSVWLEFLGDVFLDEQKKYKASLKKIIGETGLERNVRFAGAVPHDQVPEYLKKAGVSINLCPEGSYDKAALESMASGLPTIVHNPSFLPFFREARIDEALFFLEKPDPEALAGRIVRIMEMDQEELNRIMERLSVLVLSSHGLSSLSGKIFREISEMTKRTGISGGVQ